MEVSNEILKKIFLTYIGQKCMFGYTLERKGVIDGYCEPFGVQVFDSRRAIIPNHNVNPKLIKLILRTIDQLTDEEWIELAKRFGYKSDHYVKGDNMIIGLAKERVLRHSLKLISAEIYQYLISIGIDLPSIHLDGKTLIESGLAIRKEDSNEK